MTTELERILARHFVDRYYGLILLPNCHRDFYEGWINEILGLMTKHRALHYSVLACSASHVHFIDMSTPMQERALTYYSGALSGLSTLLAGESEGKLEYNNGLLMSVMMLYIHGVSGNIGFHSRTTSPVLILDVRSAWAGAPTPIFPAMLRRRPEY
jgi:hypothetical protein